MDFIEAAFEAHPSRSALAAFGESCAAPAPAGAVPQHQPVHAVRPGQLALAEMHIRPSRAAGCERRAANQRPR